jgi:hypothetical protein
MIVSLILIIIVGIVFFLVVSMFVKKLVKILYFVITLFIVLIIITSLIFFFDYNNIRTKITQNSTLFIIKNQENNIISAFNMNFINRNSTNTSKEDIYDFKTIKFLSRKQIEQSNGSSEYFKKDNNLIIIIDESSFKNKNITLCKSIGIFCEKSQEGLLNYNEYEDILKDYTKINNYLEIKDKEEFEKIQNKLKEDYNATLLDLISANFLIESSQNLKSEFFIRQIIKGKADFFPKTIFIKILKELVFFGFVK